MCVCVCSGNVNSPKHGSFLFHSPCQFFSFLSAIPSLLQYFFSSAASVFPPLQANHSEVIVCIHISFFIFFLLLPILCQWHQRVAFSCICVCVEFVESFFFRRVSFFLSLRKSKAILCCCLLNKSQSDCKYFWGHTCYWHRFRGHGKTFSKGNGIIINAK